MPALVLSPSGASLLANVACERRAVIIRHAVAVRPEDVTAEEQFAVVGLIEEAGRKSSAAVAQQQAQLSAEAIRAMGWPPRSSRSPTRAPATWAPLQEAQGAAQGLDP